MRTKAETTLKAWEVRLLAILSSLVILMVMITLVVQLGHQTSNADDDSAKTVSTQSDPDSSVLPKDTLYARVNAGFAELRPIFQRGCFDCHSTQTKYPWYHKLPLVRGLIDSDIREGRSHLDMTKGFPFVGSDNPFKDLREIKEEIEEGGMPLLSYRLMHWGAAPSDEEKQRIYDWIDSSLTLAGVPLEPEQSETGDDAEHDNHNH